MTISRQISQNPHFSHPRAPRPQTPYNACKIWHFREVEIAESDFWSEKVILGSKLTFGARGDFGARISYPRGAEDDEAARAGPHTVRWGGRRRALENLCRVRAARPPTPI